MKEEKIEKSSLFPIGEVSRLFHVSVSILRYYDKTGLLKPEYTDPDTGYRYYSVRQFECLNTIRYLRALDMPLEEIDSFLKNRNIEKIYGLLEKQKAEVQRRRQELLLIERKIDNRLNQISDALSSKLLEIREVETPARRLAFVNVKVTPRTYLDLEQSIRELEQQGESAVTFLGKVGIGLSEKKLVKREFFPYDMVFILLDEEDSFKGETLLLPAERVVSIRFQGGHENAAEYYGMLMDYIEENGLTVSGFSQEITMIDYGFTDDTSKFVTEIRIPTRKATTA